MKTATASNPNQVRATLQEVVPPSSTKPGYIVLAIPGSQYLLHLRPIGDVTTPIGKRTVGTITAQARRVDSTVTGGQFIEPVHGRPRRLQGTIVAVDASANTITVDAGGSVAVDGLPLPVVCKLTDARNQAGAYAVGQFVGFDVLDGASFKQA
ncbi:MAG: hypothetical protein ACK54T_06970 [bacterium]